MTTAKKRIRTVWKYHYDMVKICRETDVIYTKCRVCKWMFPSDTDHFARDTHAWSEREIQPVCKECMKILRKERKNNSKKNSPIKFIEAHSLFEKPCCETETVETKLDKVISFLSNKFWMK